MSGSRRPATGNTAAARLAGIASRTLKDSAKN